MCPWPPPQVGANSTLQNGQSIDAALKTFLLQSGEGGNHYRFSTWLLRHKLSPESWQIFQYQQLNPLHRVKLDHVFQVGCTLCCPGSHSAAVPRRSFFPRKNNERCQSLCYWLSCSLGMSEQSLRNRRYREKGE